MANTVWRTHLLFSNLMPSRPPRNATVGGSIIALNRYTLLRTEIYIETALISHIYLFSRYPCTPLPMFAIVRLCMLITFFRKNINRTSCSLQLQDKFREWTMGLHSWQTNDTSVTNDTSASHDHTPRRLKQNHNVKDRGVTAYTGRYIKWP